VIARITSPSFNAPWGVAVTADGSKVYVTNNLGNGVSVIDAYSKTVTATIQVNGQPQGVAVTPNGSKVYVTSPGANTVTVIDNTTGTVTPITVPGSPFGVAVNPSGTLVYVTQQTAGSVAVIATSDDSLTTIPLSGGSSNRPMGVAVNPKDGNISGAIHRVYVANNGTGTVSVIDTMTKQELTQVSLPTNSRPVTVALPVLGNYKIGDRLWITLQGTSPPEVSVMNTANNVVNHHIKLSAGCSVPFGLAGAVETNPEDELTLWAAVGGCGDVIDFDAQRAVGDIVGLFEGFQLPIAFGQFIGPAPKASGLTAQAAATASDPCGTPFDGTFNGDLTVAGGDSCLIVNGGQVTGNVTVTAGGNFVLSGAAVAGSVTVDGGGFTIGPAATVGGDLLVSNLPASSTGNAVRGTTVEGTLQVDGNAAPVQIGSASPMVCAGNKIGGDLVVDGNSASAQIFDNQVSGSLQANSNTGVLDVVGNAVGTTLQCQNNSMLVMGGNNTAGQITGQCN
jgi:YVTN family beta-propeller protein